MTFVCVSQAGRARLGHQAYREDQGNYIKGIEKSFIGHFHKIEVFTSQMSHKKSKVRLKYKQSGRNEISVYQLCM